MLKNIFLAIALAGLPGCGGSTDTSEDECVKNLQILNGAAKSYALVNKLSNSALINPGELAGFLKDGQPPKCPLGTASYEPFTLSAGPVCPNNPAHTAKFRESKKKQ